MGIEPLRDRPWVLLPGTLCTGAVFRGLLDRIGVPEVRRSTILLNQPNVGAYAGALRDVPVDAVVCGFSLGAILATHHADRLTCARLILFAVTPHADDPAKAEDRRAFARRVETMGGGAALAPALPVLNGPDPDGARVHLLDMADAAAPDIAAQTRLALTRPGALPALSRARMPVHVLTGAFDRHTPPEAGRAASSAAPSGRFRLLARLGHYALSESPGACADALAEQERPT